VTGVQTCALPIFKAAYKVIINKERGPKLATLILAATPEKILKLLKQLK
jgi:lysyl-tRNA synthetase class I